MAPRVPARVAAFVRRGCGINGNQGLAYAYSGVRRSRSYSPGGGRRILRPAARIMSCSGPWSTLISPLAAGFSFRSQVPARTASGAASLACAYVRRQSGAAPPGSARPAWQHAPEVGVHGMQRDVQVPGRRLVSPSARQVLLRNGQAGRVAPWMTTIAHGKRCLSRHQSSGKPRPALPTRIGCPQAAERRSIAKMTGPSAAIMVKPRCW